MPATPDRPITTGRTTGERDAGFEGLCNFRHNDAAVNLLPHLPLSAELLIFVGSAGVI